MIAFIPKHKIFNKSLLAFLYALFKYRCFNKIAEVPIFSFYTFSIFSNIVMGESWMFVSLDRINLNK